MTLRKPDNGLYDLVREHLAGKKSLVGIEIGSFAGESASIFLCSGAFVRLYCVDPWESGYDQLDKASDAERLRRAEECFDTRFRRNPKVVKMKDSFDNFKDLFQDNSVDFIYIDGNHKYEAVKLDIDNAFPKVKPGGIIAGHDYGSARVHLQGVTKAVDEFFGKPPQYRYKDTSWLYYK